MELNELLLRTAFACMACDGDIAPEEVQLIKDYAKDSNIFGDIDVDKELDLLLKEINSKGKRFLKEYLSKVYEATLNEEEKIQLLNVAVRMIRADNVIEYSEIKFFKVIRSNLKAVNNDTILEKVDGITEDFLAEDIRADHLQLYDDYFENIEIPKFDLNEFNNSVKSSS